MAEKRAAVKDAEFKAGVLLGNRKGWTNRETADHLGMDESTFSIRMTGLRKAVRANEPELLDKIVLKRSPRTGGGAGRKAGPYRSLASVLANMDAPVDAPAEVAVEPAAAETAVVADAETPVAPVAE